MADTSDLSKIRFQFKRQSAVDVPALGAGGYGIDLLPSQGLQAQVQAIASAMIKRNRMKKRSRRGTVNTTASYDTELVAGVFEEIGPGLLGAADWTAAIVLSETDLTSVTISGTGTVLTFGGGDLIALGARAGMFFRFTNLATGGNDGKWIPILTVGGGSNRVITVPTGYLVDETIDSAFGFTLARHLETPTHYVDTYYSVEEYSEMIDRSKYVTNARFHSLVFSESPTNFSKISLSLAARELQMLTSGAASPAFTDPVTYPEGESLVLLDGGVFINGTKRLMLTAMTFGITAPVSTTAVIGSVTGPPAKIGDFEFTGSVTGVVEDGTDFDSWVADDSVSLLAHYKDKVLQSGIGVYAGNLGYSTYGSAAGGAGDQTQTIALYGGDDDRGAGYAPTTLLISDLVP